MNFRQWTINSPSLNRQAHDDGVYAKPMVKVLGLNWNTNIDTLSLSLTKLIKETNSTEKRLQEISIKLILKRLRPAGICGTSHSL